MDEISHALACPFSAELGHSHFLGPRDDFRDTTRVISYTVQRLQQRLDVTGLCRHRCAVRVRGAPS